MTEAGDERPQTIAEGPGAAGTEIADGAEDAPDSKQRTLPQTDDRQDGGDDRRGGGDLRALLARRRARQGATGGEGGGGAPRGRLFNQRPGDAGNEGGGREGQGPRGGMMRWRMNRGGAGDTGAGGRLHFLMTSSIIPSNPIVRPSSGL